MNTQKALLLLFREPIQANDDKFETDIKFNIKLGLWETEGGDVVIESIIKSRQLMNLQTMKTATREGIDQSEISFSMQNTMITKTREGVDQSEAVDNCFDRTSITDTREGIDQSESASNNYL